MKIECVDTDKPQLLHYSKSRLMTSTTGLCVLLDRVTPSWQMPLANFELGTFCTGERSSWAHTNDVTSLSHKSFFSPFFEQTKKAVEKVGTTISRQ